MAQDFIIGVVHSGISKKSKKEFRFGVAKPTFVKETKTWLIPPENANVYTEDPKEFANVKVGYKMQLS